MLKRYVGYLDLLDFIDFEPHDSSELLKHGFAVDYAFTETPESETILFTCLDKLHIIAFDRVQELWSCVRRVNIISGLDIRIIKNVKITCTSLNNIIILFNNQQIATINSSL
jgi:hypothetical protein